MISLDEIERAIFLLKSAQDLSSDVARTAVEQAILKSITAPEPLKVINLEEVRDWEEKINPKVEETSTNLAIGQMYRDGEAKPIKRDRPKIGHDYTSTILEYINELGKNGLTSTDLQEIVEPEYRHRVSDSLGYLFKRGRIRRVLQTDGIDTKGSHRDLWCYYPLR